MPNVENLVMERVAIVLEDDPNVRFALALLLEDWGWKAVAGAEAGDVLKLMNGGASNMVIVTDYNLGEGITGVDEVKKLAANGVKGPVLVLSGSMRGRAQVAAEEAGHDYLAKPVRPEALEDWLKKFT